MDIQAIEILKWIGIVLAAGFIGYFGRYLAMLIIERVHKKQQPPKTPRARKTTGRANKKSDNVILNRLNKKIEESQLKSEKKLAKIEAKRAKKAQGK